MKLLEDSQDIIAQRYRIVAPLGSGGTAITYLARDLENNCDVALKALSLRHTNDWDAIGRFEREAAVLAKLNYPAIPRYRDYFYLDTPQDRSFYIVQELASGESLAALVENGWHCQESEIRQIAIQILEILVYLHQLTPPVIHRDIKPQNIIRASDGQIFLVDFGAVQNTYYSTLAKGNSVVGTFGYMAPEQFVGKAVPATDLYGLGSTLLFLLTHRSPADLPTNNLKIDLSSSRLQMSGGFADWLEKMLEPDLEARFSSAREALADLQSQRIIIPKPSSHKPWQRYLKIGIATATFALTINFCKYPILSTIGLTPAAVYEAVEKGDISTVKQYLDWGVNVNARDGDSMTPLHRAGSEEIAELLIAKGADVNAKDRYGWTPLHYARSVKLAELLIANGADIQAKSQYTKSELFGINLNPDLGVMSTVIKYFSGITPLHVAQSPEIAQLLITKGADVNAKAKNGITPLYLAQSKEIADLLLANGAQIDTKEVNHKYFRGKNILHRAAEIGSQQMVKILLLKGANIVSRDDAGRTPLHLASRKEVAQLLIADVNARDNCKRTPLHTAASRGNKEVVQLLIEHSADVNARDYANRTPLDYAKKDAIELLKKYSATSE